MERRTLLEHRESPDPSGGHDWRLVTDGELVYWHEWKWDSDDEQDHVDAKFSCTGFASLLAEFQQNGEARLSEEHEFSCGHFVRGEDGKFYDVEPPKRWVCIAELLRGRRSDDSDACAVLMVRGEHWHGSRVQIKCIPPSLFEEFGGLPSP